MLLSVARNAVIQMPPTRCSCNDVPSPGQKEPGRVSAEEMAAEANFANPLGAAQATMAKINAAQAKKAPEPPNPSPQAAMPAAPADVGIKAHIIMAGQPASPGNLTGNLLGNPPPALASSAPRGAQFNLQA